MKEKLAVSDSKLGKYNKYKMIIHINYIHNNVY